MPKIVWEPRFSVGHEEIDEQHRQWIAIYNRAHDRMMSADTRDLVSVGSDALKDMLDYGRYHLDFEERLMEEIAYPEISQHKAQHRHLLEKIDSLRLSIHKGEGALNSEIIKVVENWLLGHILKEDLKLKPYMVKS